MSDNANRPDSVEAGQSGPGIEDDALPAPTERDVLALDQIVEACKAIERFCAGHTFDDFTDDDLLSSAVERKIMIIGEAASPNSKRLNDAFKNAHPEVPWTQLAGMRNVLAHQYDTVLLRIVWETATKDIPALRAMIEPVLEQETRRLTMKDLGQTLE